MANRRRTRGEQETNKRQIEANKKRTRDEQGEREANKRRRVANKRANEKRTRGEREAKRGEQEARLKFFVPTSPVIYIHLRIRPWISIRPRLFFRGISLFPLKWIHHEADFT